MNRLLIGIAFLALIVSERAEGRESVPTRAVANDDLRWGVKMGLVGSLQVADGKVYAGTNTSRGEPGAVSQRRGDVHLRGVVDDNDLKNPLCGGSSLVCLDLKTGALLWRSAHPRVSRPEGFAYYPISAGIEVVENRVYYLSTNWELMCVDSEGFRDGENDGPFKQEAEDDEAAADVVWRIDLRKDLGIAPRMAGDVGYLQPSPVLSGDTLFMVTGNGGNPWPPRRVPAPDAPSFIAVDRNTGKIRWQSALPGEKIYWQQCGTPAQDGGHVLFPGGDGVLYRLAAKDGSLKGKIDINAAGSTMHLYFSNRIVQHEGLAITSVGGCMEEGAMTSAPLIAVDSTKATLDGAIDDAVRWKYTPKGGIWGNPLVSRGTLFVPFAYHRLAALDPSTGKLRWECEVSEGHERMQPYASPLVIGDHLYCTTEDGVLYELSISNKGRVVRALEFESAFSYHATPIRVPGGMVAATVQGVYRFNLGP